MTGYVLSHKRQVVTFIVSVVLSVMLVALMAFGATTIDATSVGIGTSTPGGALGVKGAAFVDGFALANNFVATSSGSIFQWENNDATSTTYAVGVGGFGSVKGDWNIDATSSASSFVATNTLSVGSSSPSGSEFSVVGHSVLGGDLNITGLLDVQSTGTSSINGGLEIESTTFIVDSSSNRIGFATSVWPTVMGGGAVNSDETPFLVAGGGSASTTLFLAGGADIGSSIILASTDGNGCVAIMATVGAIDEAADSPAVVLSVTSVPCPSPAN